MGLEGITENILVSLEIRTVTAQIQTLNNDSLINSPPISLDNTIIINPSNYSGSISIPLADYILDNDGQDTNLNASIVGYPKYGSLEPIDQETGNVIYTSNQTYPRNDSFTYLASDGIEPSNTATITLVVIENLTSNNGDPHIPLNNTLISNSFEQVAKNETKSWPLSLNYSKAPNASVPGIVDTPLFFDKVIGSSQKSIPFESNLAIRNCIDSNIFFRDPKDLEINPNTGNLYVVELFRIQEFTSDGQFLSVVVDLSDNGFYGPGIIIADMSIDSVSNVFYLSMQTKHNSSNTLSKYTFDGQLIKSWLTGSGEDLKNIAVNSQTGAIYVVNSTILQQFSADGNLVNAWPVGTGKMILDKEKAAFGDVLVNSTDLRNIAVNPQTGAIYVVNSTILQQFSADGNLVNAWPVGNETDVEIEGTYNVDKRMRHPVVDPDTSDILITKRGYIIEQYDTQGSLISSLKVKTNSSEEDTNFHYFKGMAVDPQTRNIFVTPAGEAAAVEKLDDKGESIKMWGHYGDEIPDPALCFDQYISNFTSSLTPDKILPAIKQLENLVNLTLGPPSPFDLHTIITNPQFPVVVDNIISTMFKADLSTLISNVEEDEDLSTSSLIYFGPANGNNGSKGFLAYFYDPIDNKIVGAILDLQNASIIKKFDVSEKDTQYIEEIPPSVFDFIKTVSVVKPFTLNDVVPKALMKHKPFVITSSVIGSSLVYTFITYYDKQIVIWAIDPSSDHNLAEVTYHLDNSTLTAILPIDKLIPNSGLAEAKLNLSNSTLTAELPIDKILSFANRTTAAGEDIKARIPLGGFIQ